MSITIHTNLSLFRKPELAALFAEHNCDLCFLRDPWAKPDRQADWDALLVQAADIEYLIWGVNPLAGLKFFQKAAKLRLISAFGAGMDHLNIPLATEHGVLVANTPGANAKAVAELVMAFIFALGKYLVPLHNNLMQGTWKPHQVADIFGATLGIAGFGHIGQTLAKLASSLGMRVLTYNRTHRPELAAACGATQVASLAELLPQADFLSLNLPAMPGGQALIGKAELALMKPEAFLINTGRGNLVDLDALCAALADKRLAGAALDVFPKEPLNRTDLEAMPHPLYSLPNVICTPHMAAITPGALREVTLACIDNVTGTAAGLRTPNAANPEVYTRLKWQK